MRSAAASVGSLPLHARRLFDTCLDAFDPLWNPSAGLLRRPSTRSHDVRASVRYALGLLVRGEADDRARAVETVEAVLRHQFREDPGTVYYGTWARTPSEYERRPIEAPAEWDDYDPNWREFIGSTLALVHDLFGERLPADICSQITDANRRATQGTLGREVSPGYSNVALMRAFLILWTARRLGNDEWVRAAEAYADRVYGLFGREGSLCEFNSPTYTGVSLNALGYWTTVPRVDSLRERGESMERALWEQLGEFFHPTLRTLCGPYDRAYGMDTRGSISNDYAWLATEGVNGDPPVTSHHTAVPANYGATLLAILLRGWSAVPDDVVSMLRSFDGEREIRRTVGCPHHETVATAWLGATRMMGGFSFTPEYTRTGDTLHVATLHWQADEGALGWGRIRSTDGSRPDAVARREALDVRQGTEESVVVELSVPTLTPSMVSTAEWQLPGLDVTIRTNASEIRVERSSSDTVLVQYSKPDTDDLVIRLRTRTPRQNHLP